MNFQGVYRNGVIVPNGPVPFSEGAVVDMSQAVLIAEETEVTQPEKGWLLKLVQPFMVDSPDIPTDLAAQHDHYLYGATKQ